MYKIQKMMIGSPLKYDESDPQDIKSESDDLDSFEGNDRDHVVPGFYVENN